jgi:3-methyladenine DNA glycosylase AlkD
LIAEEQNSTLTNVGVGAGSTIVSICAALAVFLRELSKQRETFKRALIRQVTVQKKSNTRMHKSFRTALQDKVKQQF